MNARVIFYAFLKIEKGNNELVVTFVILKDYINKQKPSIQISRYHTICNIKLSK